MTAGIRRRAGRHSDRGSVTAELALSIPMVVVLVLAGMTAVEAVATKLQCVDAAREAARAAARGASGDEAGRRAAPRDATIAMRGDAVTVHATVTAPVPMLVHALPTITVRCSAVAAREPDATP